MLNKNSVSASHRSHLPDTAPETLSSAEREQRLQARIETLEAERSRLEAALYSLSVGVTLCDGDGTLLLTNQAAQLFPAVEQGLPEPYGAQTAEFALHALDGTPLARDTWPLARILRGEMLSDFEAEVRHLATGTSVLARFSGTPVRNASGDVIAAVLTTRDITVEKQTEVSLAYLRYQNDLLLQAAGEGIYAIDTDGIASFANPAAARLLGWDTPEELVGKPMHDTIHHHYADGTSYREADCPIYAAFREGTVQQGDNEVFWRRDGSSFPVEYISTPILADDELVGAVVTFKDISHRKRLEQELLQSQKMDGIGRLAGGIAHEFNNLLSVVLGYAELLEMELDTHSPLLPNVQNIQYAASRAANLTRQLLTFARRQVTSTQTLDLHRLLHGMDQMLKPLVGEQIELVTVTETESALVHADPGQIEQVIVNLVVNARDAMPDGGAIRIVTERITLPDEANSVVDAVPGSYLRLSVQDTGTGMTPEVLARLFEPFFTTKEVGKGTGLGLAICYGIVRQNRGYISIQSAPGQGTTVAVYLPVAEQAPVEAASVEVVPDLFGTETVLVVEDEALLREIAVQTLQRNGYTVLQAANGVEALRVAQQYGQPESPEASIDLLLTDVIMPQMGGRELARILRQQRPGLRVLYASGYTETNFGLHASTPLDAPLLNKPFTSRDLLRKTREALTE